MAIRPAQPVSAFIDGRLARQQEDYGNTRNALANMELQQAPRDMANRNALADRQAQQYSQEQINQSLQQMAAAAMRIAQSPSPKAEMQAYPEFSANLLKQHPEMAQMDDAQLKQYMGWVAGQAQSKLGIAPTAKLETIGDTSNPAAGVLQKNPLTGEIKQVVAPQKPDRFAETQAAADRRAEEQRTFTAEQNRLNREAQQGRADAKASAAANKPAKITEGERVSANYLNRMEKAEPLLGTYRPSTADMMAFSRILNGDSEAAASLANKFLSSEAQTHFQAASDWVRAKLRKESGAVIAPQEMIQEIKTYFPMPGDSQKNIEQKRQARATATEGMRMMAGGAAKSGPVQVKTDADYARLPSGSEYIAPDGSVRTKR